MISTEWVSVQQQGDAAYGSRAGDRTRTDDIQLGKLTFYR